MSSSSISIFYFYSSETFSICHDFIFNHVPENEFISPDPSVNKEKYILNVLIVFKDHVLEINIITIFERKIELIIKNEEAIFRYLMKDKNWFPVHK